MDDAILPQWLSNVEYHNVLFYHCLVNVYLKFVGELKRKSKPKGSQHF